ncbi:MAG: hypothetical protein OEM26_12370, partial [Saprospiraceae bacterium]|nr:hypothetical protein [Saprospiraceae bacterium]
IQELVYNSSTRKLRITGGNEIQLSGGADADADPRNELQDLRIQRQNKIDAPYRISLTQGNSIDLPLTSLWRHTVQNGQVTQVYTSSPVFTKSFTAEGIDVTPVPAHLDHPRITPTEYQFNSGAGAKGMRMSRNRLAHHYATGGSKYTMFLDDNSLRFYNRSEYVTAEFGGDKGGKIKLYTGASTSPYFTIEKTNANRSQLRMYSAQTRQFIFGVNESSLGGSAASLYGSKSVNVSMGASGNADHGGLHVHDSKSVGQAGMYVDAQGRGVLYADIKNFVADHPIDRNKEIVYASLEGPEAGIYERGTAKMIDGKAIISFSEHFTLMLDDSRMTIMLTPLSADSKGLAVIEKTNAGFVVQELSGGQGNYQFDWEAKAIRKGFEEFQVVRPKTQ